MSIKLEVIISIMSVQIAKVRAQSFNVRKQHLQKAVKLPCIHYFCFSDVFLTYVFLLNESVKEKLSLLFKIMTALKRYTIYVTS